MLSSGILVLLLLFVFFEFQISNAARIWNVLKSLSFYSSLTILVESFFRTETSFNLLRQKHKKKMEKNS